MTTILNIETATKNCSVSLAKNGVLVHYKEINNGNYLHSEKLHPLIISLLQESKISFSEIDVIAVSKGPGSYTGLRIGVSAAKGFCFALDKPLISLETLYILAQSIDVKKGVIVTLLDARRMEVYSSIFDKNHKTIRKIKAEIIDENSFSSELEKGSVYFLGDGVAKCKKVITSTNAIFIDDKYPSARQMATLSYQEYKKNNIEDIAYFEPFYLKDFVVTPQKNRLIPT